MNKYLPPGAAGDPRAPWNQPELRDLLPLECELCDDFVAETEEELREHEHGQDVFVKPQRREEPEPCSICQPRDDEVKRDDYVFCENHDHETLKRQEKAIEEYRRKKMKEDRGEG